MTKDEALKLALEALENVTKDYAEGRQYKHNKAITAIKEALAQPEQEPTGMLHIDRLDKWLDASLKERKAQRTWVGLTDDEMEATFIQCGGKWNGDFWKIEDADFHPFLRSIEAKLKEKNT